MHPGQMQTGENQRETMMATLRRIESDSLQAVLHEAAKYPDWHLVGAAPKQEDGPPYVMLIRELLPEERSAERR